MAVLLQGGFLKKDLRLGTFIPLAEALGLDVYANEGQGYLLLSRPDQITTTFMARISQNGKDLQLYQTYPTAKEDITLFYQLLVCCGEVMGSSHFVLEDAGYTYEDVANRLEVAQKNNLQEINILFEKGAVTPLFRSQGAKTAFLIPQFLSEYGNSLEQQEKYDFYMRLLLYSQTVTGCVPMLYLQGKELLYVCSFPITLEAQSKISKPQLEFCLETEDSMLVLIPSGEHKPKLVSAHLFHQWLEEQQIIEKSSPDSYVAVIHWEDFESFSPASVS